jgi:hypothetical protein
MYSYRYNRQADCLTVLLRLQYMGTTHVANVWLLGAFLGGLRVGGGFGSGETK